MKLDEIAQLAGVSKTTASYVINGKADKYRISQRTRDKVLAVVKAYGFHPDHGASSLRSGKSRSIGLIIPDLENKSYAKLAKLLESNARGQGFQLLISCTDDNPETEKDVVRLLLSRKLDALITASCLTDDASFYKRIQAGGTPVIAVDRTLPSEHFTSVTSEDDDGAFLLTSRLLEASPASIALISACPELSVSQFREAGFRKALETLPVSINSEICYGRHFSPEASHNILHQWIESNTVPDAIITASFTLCEGVLDILRQKPELMDKVQLATFGDHRFLDFLPFQVQSLAQQFEVISDHVISHAIKAIEGIYQPGVTYVARKAVWR
ncbi:catabolite repressor/activator [Sansalvadorimonas verongulae]|uniref:catabolite repressor/activator n=1 Tax=Sansalvadorimonas verongulae TaxID=2172824 RepID=UPI0012BD8039|nr:catabolite repressor/activator [Sansalvadorimonas verongulae]MTI12993.1 catabolite repressor/activator [Sansalvadorimonas verongulae]